MEMDSGGDANVLAAIFDALDGRMALAKSTSAFGAALDSLSDAVVFGLCCFMSVFMGPSRVGQLCLGTLCFSYVSRCDWLIQLRIARRPEYESFFVGIPAPAAFFWFNLNCSRSYFSGKMVD